MYIDRYLQNFTPNPHHTANMTRKERMAFWTYVWAAGVGFNFLWIIQACHDPSSPQPIWSGFTLGMLAVFQGLWTLNCWFWFKMGQWKRTGNIWYNRGWALVCALTIFLIVRQWIFAEKMRNQPHIDGGPSGYGQTYIGPGAYDQYGNPIQHGEVW